MNNTDKVKEILNDSTKTIGDYVVITDSFINIATQINSLYQGEVSAEEYKNSLECIYDDVAELVHLHDCEQEGIQSGQPTPKQWIEAVDDVRNSLITLMSIKEQLTPTASIDAGNVYEEAKTHSHTATSIESEQGKEEYGKLRSDGDGHDYIIPESKVEDFDLFMEGFEACGSQGESEDVYYALLSRFEKDWGKYQIDGHQRDFRILLPSPDQSKSTNK